MATRRVVLAVGVMSLAAVAPGAPQGPAGAGAPVTRSTRPAEALLQYGRTSQPGPEHRQLGALVGSWRAEVHLLGENGTSSRLQGRSENHWVLGNRFVLAETRVGQAEPLIESLTYYGFDQTERSFFSVGLSNLSTGFAPATGTYDAASRSFVLSGRQRDAVSGLAVFYRTLLRVESPDRYVMEVFVDYGTRGPLKVMETIFTRD